jgi:hypothetical protein
LKTPPGAFIRPSGFERHVMLKLNILGDALVSVKPAQAGRANISDLHASI